MAEHSAIAWTDATWNPVRGCTRISPGCDHCYAETLSHRNHANLGEWGPFGRRSFAGDTYWNQLQRWDREAAAAGQVRRVFTASLADLFEGGQDGDPSEYAALHAAAAAAHPIVRVVDDGERPEEAADAARNAAARLSAWIAAHESRVGPRADYLPMLHRFADVSRKLSWLRFLILTKRPWNALAFARARGDWPSNWAIGATAEDQQHLNERMPFLGQVPASVRFLSLEPLLGPVTLWEADATDPHLLRGPAAEQHGGQIPSTVDQAPGEGWLESYPGVDWVIAGCESQRRGSAKLPVRPMDLAWVRSLRDQCALADVPFFFKQADVGGRVVELPELDGVVHAAVPQQLLGVA